MQVERKRALLQLVAKPAFGGLLAALVLLFATLAASPGLHKAFHASGHSNDHGCVIGLFAKGQLNSTPAALVVTAFVSFLTMLALRLDVFQIPSADYRYSSSRAPPSFSLLAIR